MWRRVLLTSALGVASCAAENSGDTTDTSAIDAASETTSGDDGNTDIDVTTDVHEEERRYEVCTSISIPTRFDAGWERLNHRISQLGFLRSDNTQNCVIDRWDLTFVGGDFTTGGVATDEAELGFAWADVVFDPAQAAAIRVPVEVLVAPGGFATGSITLTDEQSGLGNFEHVVALVGGFRLDSEAPQPEEYPEAYEPALGYTSRGLGFDIAATRDDDAATIEIEYTIRFEHGATFDGFIRPDMNAAIPHAQSAATLEIVLVGSNEAAVSADVQWLQQTAEPYRATTEREPPVEESLRTVVLPGDTGADGFVALSAFQFRLYPDTSCEADRDCDQGDTCGAAGQCALPFGPPGDYVRQLATGVETLSRDVTSGEMTVLVDGYASTASEAFAFRPLEHTFSARVARLPSGAATTWRYAGTQPTGTRSITRSDAGSQ